jgi:UrcA family protein
MSNGKSGTSKAHGLLALTATFVAFAPLCSQADVSAADSAQVKYSDLNINNVADARRLYTRIEHAANKACGTSEEDTDVIIRGPSPCVRDAVARAIQGLRNANLAQIYIEKNGPHAAQKYGISDQVLTAKN